MKNQYNDDNVFAKIIRGEISTKKIYEDDSVLAVEDISPVAPVHVLVIPKFNAVDIYHFSDLVEENQLGIFFKKVMKVVAILGVADSFRLITNKGQESGQSIFHFHVHIIAGKTINKLIAD